MTPYRHDDGAGPQPESGVTSASVHASPRLLRKAVMAVACLAVAGATFVIVDHVATGHVESRTAKAFQQGMGTPKRPSVDIRGFPVLTQLASGTLRHVDITAHDIPARGTSRPLPVTRLTVGLDDLRTSGDADQAHARAVDATAFLSYEDMSDALGFQISQDTEPGRVKARVTLPFSGEVTVSTAVSVPSDNRIAFTDVRIAEGYLPPPGRAVLDKALAEPVVLHSIPEGLHLRSVAATTTGLDARFTGDKVTFRPDTSSA
ncbi:DUF2993 domain-containing protein [Streptomyces sp. NPDC047461]|uniref:LmeA family phospholipid-binding protein n=1 Tax=Streptomyces sp. NPDC047461 TaxID=3155619 RepID=UPI0034113588